jgi:hypothetical protein
VQVAAYQVLGLRHRILTLPVMVAFVLSLVWRQIGSVSEAVRSLSREAMLWTPPVQISQQAVAGRLRSLPAVLFSESGTKSRPRCAAAGRRAGDRC